jgi:dephospho-CoA kinase
MLVAGLTGSIGMGKSAIADILRVRGVGVFDADAEVHRLYASDAIAPIEAAFPGTTTPAGVDRLKLAEALAADANGWARLEAIVHPLVRAAEQEFLVAEKKRGAEVAVLEIPLLFETGADALMDTVIVVSADRGIQRQRLEARPGMTAARIDAILSRQMPDEEKRTRAEFVVDTNGTMEESERQIDGILQALKAKTAQAFARHWT